MAQPQPDAWVTLECDWCGALVRRPNWARNRQAGRFAFCSRDHFQAFAREHFPQQNPNHYASKTWKRVRLLALDRDSHRCVDCGSSAHLVVHHQVPLAQLAGQGQPLHELDNLVTLCVADHLRRHSAL
jgi:5-methylcytosine-specific restriction endonuclease McrA